MGLWTPTWFSRGLWFSEVENNCFKKSKWERSGCWYTADVIMSSRCVSRWAWESGEDIWWTGDSRLCYTGQHMLCFCAGLCCVSSRDSFSSEFWKQSADWRATAESLNLWASPSYCCLSDSYLQHVTLNTSFLSIHTQAGHKNLGRLSLRWRAAVQAEMSADIQRWASQRGCQRRMRGKRGTVGVVSITVVRESMWCDCRAEWSRI